jgi:hypothetical protein
MDKVILTPKLAEKIQDEIFKKMTAEQKIKLVNSFFRFGKKLNNLNDRKIDGNRRSFDKNNGYIG